MQWFSPIAFNTAFEFAASVTTFTSTDGKTDIGFRYNGSVWQEVGEH